MLEEAKGTLMHDVTSIDEKEKDNLVKLTVTAVNDVTNKKGKSGRTRKTTVEITEINGIKYQILATKEEAQPAGYTVENKIRSIGLANGITNKLVEKYDNGEITQYHIRDICKINTLENVTMLDSESQEKIIETIITNRNEQNDTNSSEASIILLKNKKVSKYIVDNWYRGILRLIKKLSLNADVNDETISNLSSEQNHHLEEKLKNLISKLDTLLLLLKNTTPRP